MKKSITNEKILEVIQAIKEKTFDGSNDPIVTFHKYQGVYYVVRELISMGYLKKNDGSKPYKWQWVKHNVVDIGLAKVINGITTSNRKEIKHHSPAYQRQRKRPALQLFTDDELFYELKERGYKITAVKTLEY